MPKNDAQINISFFYIYPLNPPGEHLTQPKNSQISENLDADNHPQSPLVWDIYHLTFHVNLGYNRTDVCGYDSILLAFMPCRRGLGLSLAPNTAQDPADADTQSSPAPAWNVSSTYCNKNPRPVTSCQHYTYNIYSCLFKLQSIRQNYHSARNGRKDAIN